MRRRRPSDSGITDSSQTEKMPSQNSPIAGFTLLWGNSNYNSYKRPKGKRNRGRPIKENSRCVGPERIKKWPSFMLDDDDVVVVVDDDDDDDDGGGGGGFNGSDACSVL